MPCLSGGREEKNAESERKDDESSDEDLEAASDISDDEGVDYSAAVMYLSKLVSTRRLLRDREMFKAFGGDSFLIDGDSLLGYLLFSVSILNFGEGQMLQLMYHAEQLLQRYATLGGPFRVFFVEEHARGWSGVQLLAREALRLHLTGIGIPVDVVASSVGKGWLEYISLQRPGYVMLLVKWPHCETMQHLSQALYIQVIGWQGQQGDKCCEWWILTNGGGASEKRVVVIFLPYGFTHFLCCAGGDDSYVVVFFIVPV